MTDWRERLASLRQEIDRIDRQILDLLNKRAEIARQVGELKKEHGLRIYVPEREAEILEKLTSTNPGPFPNEAVRTIFREIISASISLEKPMRVAFLGPEATFTHMACLRHFGESAHLIPLINVTEVFESVERGEAEYGVVPIENSTEGVVSNTLDMFVEHNLNIIGEITMEVAHALLSKTGEVAHLKKIYSHPHAIAQCRGWLERHLREIPVFHVESTARAAELASEDPTAAAIASEGAAKLYGLRVIKRNIQDNINNFTRFIIIGKMSPERTGRDKTSVIFSVRDEVGALFRILEPFAKYGINLTKIESRPVKKRAWEYLFFLDMEGHIQDEKVRQAIDEMRLLTSYFKLLGSYPRSI
ncbi:MAG: prephenate dehydratase [Deltaproteobacteria bacterium]|nr:MAG: prephenate dehydratase [Deltaproteobacteria bacterium]